MIKITGLCKKINDKYILKDINLSFPSKGLVLIKGENGSGKTTLFNIISLMDTSYSGEILLDNKNIRELDDFTKSSIRNNEISYCFQKNNIVSYLSYEENRDLDHFLCGGKIKNRNQIKYQELSQGQQQLLVLHKALRKGKKIYLLDEITSCLDINNKKVIIDKVKELSKDALVIVVAHDIELSNLSEMIIQLKKGEATVIKNEFGEKNEEKRIDFKKKNRSKLSVRLLLNSIKKQAFIHFVSTFILSLLSILTISGLALFSVPSRSIIGNHFDNVELISVVTDTDDNKLGKKYSEDIYEYNSGKVYIGFTQRNTNNYFEINIIKDERFNNSNKAYVNEKVYDYIQSITSPSNVVPYLVDYDLELFVDDKCKFNCVYIGEDCIKEKRNRKANLAIVEGCGWKTNKYDKGHFRGRTFVFMNEDELIKYGVEVDSNLLIEDNCFYVFSDELASNKIITEFYSPYVIEGDYFDFNEVFSDGVRVETFQLGVLESYDYFYILVSKNTLETIWKSYHTTNLKRYIMEMNTNTQEKLNYLCDNKYRFSCYDNKIEPHMEDEELRKISGYYNTQLATKKDISKGYWSYIMTIGLVVCLINLIIVNCSYSLFINRNNNRILRKEGFSRLKLVILNSLPLTIEIIIGFIVGFIVYPLAGNYYSMYGFIPGLTPLEIVLILLLLLINFGFNAIYLRKKVG